MDFIHDRTTNGQPLKWLGIVDEFTRERLVLEVHPGITCERVLDVLVHLFLTRGVPRFTFAVTCGPKFIANTLREHLSRTHVQTLYIEPESRWENGYAESFLADCPMSC